MTLDQASAEFLATPCYPTAKAYALLAIFAYEAGETDVLEMNNILNRLEAWLKGGADA